MDTLPDILCVLDKKYPDWATSEFPDLIKTIAELTADLNQKNTIEVLNIIMAELYRLSRAYAGEGDDEEEEEEDEDTRNAVNANCHSLVDIIETPEYSDNFKSIFNASEVVEWCDYTNEGGHTYSVQA